MTTMACGLDWADRWVDCALLHRDGTPLGHTRITYATTPDPVTAITHFLRKANRTRWRTIPIGTEDPTSLLAQALTSAGLRVIGIDPMIAARHRTATTQGLTKNDRTDAYLLADMLRQKIGSRPAPQDSPQARAISVLARAQSRAVTSRARALHQLRAALTAYYQAAVTAWPRLGLRHPQARAVLAAAPTPTAAATLTRAQYAEALRKGGRWRTVDDEAERLQLHFRRPALSTDPIAETAHRTAMLALLADLTHACTQADRLADELATTFTTHPHAPIITSFPGIGTVLGGRILAETGDDPARFATGRALCAYAGVVPVTWASGTSHRVSYRKFANHHLRDALRQAAFCALTRSPGAASYYRSHRAKGNSHSGALRILAARLTRSLHHCLATGENYNERIAFPDSRGPPTAHEVPSQLRERVKKHRIFRTFFSRPRPRAGQQRRRRPGTGNAQNIPGRRIPEPPRGNGTHAGHRLRATDCAQHRLLPAHAGVALIRHRSPHTPGDAPRRRGATSPNRRTSRSVGPAPGPTDRTRAWLSAAGPSQRRVRPDRLPRGGATTGNNWAG
ncbi:IS110 family transposase [Streptomyces xiamenensis]|uniref:IS110 family transposase n=1 Tax=Streptomyces xiamenensis TaxID=408015 RepID=UPI0036EE280D